MPDVRGKYVFETQEESERIKREVEKTFMLLDLAGKTVTEFPCEGVVIPLTFGNRLRLLAMAFSLAKLARFGQPDGKPPQEAAIMGR